jgi:hypothetical protein
MREEKSPKNKSHSQLDEALSQLIMTPADAFERAISHGKDSAYAVLSTVEDSQIALAWAVREAMQKLEIGIFNLHELTGLTCDYIDAILEARADISDSEPIGKLEQALHVRLNHL